MTTTRERPVVILDVESILASLGTTRSWLDRPSAARTLLEFGRMLGRLVEEIHPAAIVAVVTVGPGVGSGGAAVDPGLQSGELEGQVRRLLADLGIPVVEADGDGRRGSLAALARRFAACRPVLLVSADKYLDQIVAGRVRVVHPDLRRTHGPAEIEAKWGVPPALIPDLLALAGDPPTDLRGVEGIDLAEARRLLREFGSLEALIRAAGTVKPTKLGEAIAAGAGQVRQAYARALTSADGPLPAGVDGSGSAPTAEQVAALLRRLEAAETGTPVTDSAAVPPSAAPDVTTLEDLDSLLAAAASAGRLLIDVEGDGPDPMRARIVAVLLSPPEGPARRVRLAAPTGGAAGDLPPEDVLRRLRPVLADLRVEKTAHDVKRIAILLRRMRLEVCGFAFDVMLGSYLLDPEKHGHTVEEIAAERIGDGGQIGTVPSRRPARGRRSRTRGTSGERQVRVLETVRQLVDPVQSALGEAGLTELLLDVELPLADVLAVVEMTGVLLDAAKADALEEQFRARVAALDRRLRRLANGPFDPNSKTQVADLLFRRLGLMPPPRIADEESTNRDVLEHLVGQHPIVELVIERRRLAAFLTNFLVPLRQAVDQTTGRIHTSFDQARAATGRITSRNPCLQNIPVRGEDGRRIRDLFVAQPGWKIISADYGQIEPRILAHLSKDRRLAEAFIRGDDVYERTARDILGIPKSKPLPDGARATGKVLTLAPIYGETEYGVAAKLGVSLEEAREFLRRFFARYSGVRRYLDEVIVEARASGMVRTLLGRRRLVRDLHARNPYARAAAERAASNAVVQGSAADILKLAMLRVERRLTADRMRARMILTVHDEIVLEAPDEEVEAATEIVRYEMERAAALDVPLKVSIGVGTTWGEAMETASKGRMSSPSSVMPPHIAHARWNDETSGNESRS
jgi:DNA polymerase-1